MRKLRLRTKFLVSLLAISAGLTSATLFVVRYEVQKQVRASLQEDLRNSVVTYRTFDEQREAILTRSADLLANVPTFRALMTTQDARTIQDGAEDLFSVSGTDLLALADRTGGVVALRTREGRFEPDAAEALLRGSLRRGDARDWWFAGGHLYEVWIQPIYFGAASDNTVLGYMAVGYETNGRSASDFSQISAADITFFYGDTIVASTLDSNRQRDLLRLAPRSSSASDRNREMVLDGERYLETKVPLSSTGVPVSLSILKSFDKATSFLAALNHVLVALGLASVLAGSALVFAISATYTQPLAGLVEGVRALEKGDFGYPLESSGGDEVAEVTRAFDRMRGTLQKTQSEQKLLEERLRQAVKMEAVGRLAGGVAHDFNNLLTIIRGHGDLLESREGLDEAERRSVEQIQKASDRAVSMTRQLLAFSRMQVLQPRVLDLNAVISEMGKMLPRLIGEHIEYAFIPDPKLSSIKADPGQIEQVILNLAVNARDAMPEGGKLMVRTEDVMMDREQAAQRAPMPPGRYVLLAVSDTGQGMDAETKARIFEPFFTTKEVGKGTGLGLATVYGVVKQSGGYIWVESEPGRGATFEIYLPGILEKPAGTAEQRRPQPAPRGSETILVVEDEAGVRELACEFLRSSGYSVLEAKDGFEAVRISENYGGTIHLLLSDIIMPGMNGSALAERLRGSRPGIKVALMSGYSEYAAGSGNDRSGSDFLFQKPFSQQLLTEKVREILSGRSVDRVQELARMSKPEAV